MINDLCMAKFKTSSKEKQDGLIKFLFESTYSKEKVIDYLNGKKARNNSLNITEGDFIKFNINVDTYPRFNRDYYHENNLVIDEKYIRVKVVCINPINNYIRVELMSSNLQLDTYLLYESNFEKQISESDLLLYI
jgi:hypothetical protein